jgi:diguanylate cyclase (GGDEF)-like protein
MKLRNKVLIGVGIIWVLFLVITYLGSEYFLLRSFLRLEADRANRDLARIDQSIDQINNSLFTFTSDWAHWTDMYDYIQGKKPEFIPNNINMTAFVNSTINFLSYWDKQSKLLIGISVDIDHSTLISFPKGLEKYIYAGSPLLSLTDRKKDIRGYMLLEDGIMMVASVAATDGDIALPPLGVMITGRWISPKIIEKIQENTKLQVELVLPTQITNDPVLNKILATVTVDKEGHYNEPINEDTLQGYTLLRDIFNKPIGMFKMTAPRSLYLTGREAVHYYLASFLILGIIFSFIIVALLRRLIISRLEKLDQNVEEIAAKNLLSKRVDASGNDELSTLSSQINDMLDIIQASQNKLEQRVEERTQELKQTNIQLEQEITERKSVEKELIIHKEHLVRLAHYDALTSLPNRVFFNEMLNKSINHASRHNKTLAILFIDLDRFKTINDALGHTIGDLVLKEIANRFASTLRAGDVIARLGGDEFIILLNDVVHPKYVSSVAEKILLMCKDPVVVKSHEFFLTTSIGICIYPTDGTSLEDLQKNADMAMYKAKRAGGGNYQYFTQEMNVQAHEHIQLEAALRKAFTNHEFILHYQPKYRLTDGMIVGVEALMRWDSPELGMISPAKFIPLSEETGLIMQLGEWALREACRANKSWQDQGYQPISVAVNLSPKQFRHLDISKLVETVLNETQLSPQSLELEITESAVMDNVAKASSKLNNIKQMGVGISVDDFGTGYTSISYLKQFPINVLKIDQSFIKGIPENQNDLAITSAIIALAHSLDIKVVAEGVETAEQLQFLADQDCDIVQGYYLSRPLPETKLLALLPKASATPTKEPV